MHLVDIRSFKQSLKQICIDNRPHSSTICTSNSRVIVRGEAECNFDCYAYNSSQIVRKCGRLPINRTAKIKTVKVRHNKMMFMISHSKI